MAAVGNARNVTVPDIGDFVDVPVIEILVEPGQHVAAEDPLVVLESDKATMEVPAPFAGVVAELKVALGDRVSEGATLLVLDVAGENGASAPEQPPPAPAARPDRPAAEAGSPRSVESAIAAEVQSGEHAPPPPQPPPPTPGEVPIYASPSVRRLARERGIDLSAIQGSGRKGRITKEDLERPAAAAPAAAPAGRAPSAGEGERVPLTRIQQLSRDALTRSWQTIPHVTQHDEADITELEAFRKQLNAEQSDVKVTMVALLLKACSATLDAFPRFASSLDGDELVVKRERHLGFAADTPNGLVVPVIHDVGQKGLLELAGELTELSGKARAGKLGPKDISGAVFTISSLGGIGGTAFTPIVNLPQVAILGVVRSAMKPVWNGSDFEPRLMLPLSLSYDHRVIDGAAAARFCVHLKGVLEDLRRVLL
ncbi:MAG TPA: 2-oxo acid dehydrogenase subunit E2 [Solirubrobacteraceae bacterium]|nr:2-oxo acid dehydrogenase subunit E2 [Solirubrobacteraceae bacterium]